MPACCPAGKWCRFARWPPTAPNLQSQTRAMRQVKAMRVLGCVGSRRCKKSHGDGNCACYGPQRRPGAQRVAVSVGVCAAAGGTMGEVRAGSLNCSLLLQHLGHAGRTTTRWSLLSCPTARKLCCMPSARGRECSWRSAWKQVCLALVPGVVSGVTWHTDDGPDVIVEWCTSRVCAARVDSTAERHRIVFFTQRAFLFLRGAKGRAWIRNTFARLVLLELNLSCAPLKAPMLALLMGSVR